ncbi:hypothetical protein HZH66_011092 [Vespula vulgaris]|uniref:Uncharacterized protein n=1 Tax=Vespula vulgaris TaxID=7454 RepID=A0A834MVD8_VESVU|nr:hypothetical protein HZH66_011092 [Vespula vulgaris]
MHEDSGTPSSICVDVDRENRRNTFRASRCPCSNKKKTRGNGGRLLGLADTRRGSFKRFDVSSALTKQRGGTLVRYRSS